MAQVSTPYKLILNWAQGGIIAIDYPNKARCDRAKAAVDEEYENRVNRAPKTLPNGGVIIGSPWVVYAFCIPG